MDLIEEPVNYLDISHAVTGYMNTTVGPIARIETQLQLQDFWHDGRARLSIKRNALAIAPGLFAVGNPGELSPVLVTANYKLTFDKLRMELTGLDLWILVIETKGVNVWCSAGKGTFSAQEIINWVRQTSLDKVVAHRQLILPQLAAPGVVAHSVTKFTGFKVVYGPIRAGDIRAFIANGNKANADMRRVTFNLSERIVLTPVELVLGFKFFPFIFIVFGLLNLLNNGGLAGGNLLKVAGYNSLAYWLAIVIGTVLVPIMLPLLPFRSFALKGTVAGIIWSILVIYWGDVFQFSSHLTVMLGNSLLLTALISFLALNFTGSTPYTSFTGTQKETLAAVPIQIIASLAGLTLLIVSRFTGI